MVVVFVITLVAGIAIPSLQRLSGAQLSSAARTLGQTVRFVAGESALRGLVLAIELDLDEEAYWVSRLDPESGELVRDDSIRRGVTLGPDLELVTAILPDQRQSRGIARVRFFPEGFADPATVEIGLIGGEGYAVRVDPVRGIARIEEADLS